MLRMFLCAAVVMLSASAFAEAVSDRDRFELWNRCSPVRLLAGLQVTESDISLTEESIEVAVRSRLRAARLYSEDAAETNWSGVAIEVHVVGAAYNMRLRYDKLMRDEATMQIYTHTTWLRSFTGTHGENAGYVLSGVAGLIDEFIDEYLRVNADACD